MRKNIVAGNWKMNTTLAEGVGLAKDVNEALKGATPKCDVVICVPFTHLASVAAAIDQTKLGLGAEIGICTSKLHSYGAMGVRELTTTKFVALGTGQIRE